MSRTRLPASPPARTSYRASTSKPERSASSAASASAAVVVPTISWLQAFARDPAPSGPSRRTVVPMALEQRQQPAEVRFVVGSGHDGQGSLGGALGAPADWRVHDHGVACAGFPDAAAEFGGRPPGETLLMTTRAVPAAGGFSVQPARSPAAAVLDVPEVRQHEDGHRARRGVPPRHGHARAAGASKSSRAAGDRFQAATDHPRRGGSPPWAPPSGPGPRSPLSVRSIACSLTSSWIIYRNLFSILASIQYDEHHDD